MLLSERVRLFDKKLHREIHCLMQFDFSFEMFGPLGRRFDYRQCSWWGRDRCGQVERSNANSLTMARNLRNPRVPHLGHVQLTRRDLDMVTKDKPTGSFGTVDSRAVRSIFLSRSGGRHVQPFDEQSADHP